MLRAVRDRGPAALGDAAADDGSSLQQIAARLRPKPHVYAYTHLANSASLLLPVSNLTNLLAFRASDLSFARFRGAPWPSTTTAAARDEEVP